ncbi:hypothetical protein D4764_08G0006880 [Takifugu flavidus]|uniref:Uncharacterized protein n=1 Tax=Takifugu flavidus TaxID=433684 RepID=A0A5C6MRB4_9TELE|nr:hypothetical protein D4764_08G0006880 [Takifugu flavidus]
MRNTVQLPFADTWMRADKNKQKFAVIKGDGSGDGSGRRHLQFSMPTCQSGSRTPHPPWHGHSWSRSVEEEEVYEEFGVFPFCPCLPPLLIASSLRSDTHADRVETLRERVCRFNAAHTLPGDSSVTSGRKHRLDLSLSHPPPRAGAAGHAKGEHSCVKGWTVEE